MHKWGTRGLEGKWCSLTVCVPWLLNLNLASVPQCACSLGRAHMSSPPKAHSPCQPSTLMPSPLTGALIRGCDKVQPFSYDRHSGISDFEVWFSVAPLCWWWVRIRCTLTTVPLLSHYRSCATHVFYKIFLHFSVMVSAGVLHIWKGSLVICHTWGFRVEYQRSRHVAQLSIRTWRQAKSVCGHRVVLTDSGQAGWHCSATSHAHMAEGGHGRTSTWIIPKP